MRERKQTSSRPSRKPPKQTLRFQAIILLCIPLVIITLFVIWRQNDRPEYIPVIIQVEELPEDELQLTPVPRYLLTDTGYLKLVNRLLPMSRPIDYSTIVYAWPTVAVRATDIMVHETLLNALSDLFAEAYGMRPFFVTSGYRCVARQHEIYENAIDRMYVMPPGHSEHNLGLAADILVTDVTMAQMSGTPEAIWLAQNAWRHGMILRYPYGATHITQVAYEPWHFRYVGRVHAWYITMNDMVLEEYLEHLEELGGFTVELGEKTYHIMYQQPIGDNIYVPIYLQFIVSKSNRGGYIITAWE